MFLVCAHTCDMHEKCVALNLLPTCIIDMWLPGASFSTCNILSNRYEEVGCYKILIFITQPYAWTYTYNIYKNVWACKPSKIANESSEVMAAGVSFEFANVFITHKA